MHDYNEIKNQEDPIPGVSAVPLDNNMYEWHGNVKAISDNSYKGAVLHFKILFPKDYPLSPPKVYLLNDELQHPNVMRDRRICLDMFERRKGKYRGWKSGYTVLSILLQLQVFFFDVEENFLTKENKKAIKDDIIVMAEFKCPLCKHNGSVNPYPPFPETKENKLTQKKYRELKEKEICCYHRKTNFHDCALGLGISISKIPRTGEIKGIIPRFDFIAYKTYSKEKLRVSFNGEPFTHWFPLYFGEKEKKAKILKSITKAISMIAKGNTKEFKT